MTRTVSVISAHLAHFVTLSLDRRTICTPLNRLHDLPLDKVFNKTLQKKFTWAIAEINREFPDKSNKEKVFRF